MENFINCLVESMFRYIGQTVTIFTTSGGLSGNGFTGVLLSADCNVVRLLADIGANRAIIPYLTRAKFALVHCILCARLIKLNGWTWRG